MPTYAYKPRVELRAHCELPPSDWEAIWAASSGAFAAAEAAGDTEAMWALLSQATELALAEGDPVGAPRHRDSLALADAIIAACVRRPS